MSGAGPQPAPATGRLVLYWGMVLVPLLWGVFQTLNNVAKLFR